MGLQTEGGVLLAVGTSLANHSDCCCGDTCCQFTPCAGGDSITTLCGTRPAGLEVGDIVEVDGECYEYDGEVTCAGGESTPDYGAIFDTCEDCDAADCPDCDGKRLPFYITLTITAVKGGTAVCSCDDTDCAPLSGGYTLSYIGSCTWQSACVLTCAKSGLSEPCTPLTRYVRFTVLVGATIITLSMATYTASDCSGTALFTLSKAYTLGDKPCLGDSVDVGAADTGTGYCSWSAATVQF